MVGATLLEYLFSIGIAGLLMAGLISFSTNNAKNFAMLTNLAEMDQANRMTQSQMTRDFRQVTRLQAYTTNSLTFLDWDGKVLKYTYDPNGRTLVREKDGARKTMLQECDNLSFTIRQRNLIGGTFDYYPASDLNTCKVIGVDWSCTRSMFGKKVNLTSSQSARIAIRKH